MNKQELNNIMRRIVNIIDNYDIVNGERIIDTIKSLPGDIFKVKKCICSTLDNPTFYGISSVEEINDFDDILYIVEHSEGWILILANNYYCCDDEIDLDKIKRIQENQRYIIVNMINNKNEEIKCNIIVDINMEHILDLNRREVEITEQCIKKVSKEIIEKFKHQLVNGVYKILNVNLIPNISSCDATTRVAYIINRYELGVERKIIKELGMDVMDFGEPTCIRMGSDHE